MMGAQASEEQYEKIKSYLKIGKDEGAQVVVGGNANKVVDGGYYIEPTILKGTNKMRVFQEEIFGPVVAVTTFKTNEEAIKIANDTIFGLGAGVFTRDAHEAFQLPRAIQAGRVWVNCYHLYPAHAPFGGYKQSGFGRETHKVRLFPPLLLLRLVAPSLSPSCSPRSLQPPSPPSVLSVSLADDAVALQANEEHAGELRQEQARLLLSCGSSVLGGGRERERGR